MATDRSKMDEPNSHVKTMIKSLTEHETRDKMKACFDSKVEDSEWFKDITDALDKSMASPHVKSYHEMLLEVGGFESNKTDLAESTADLEKIVGGKLVNSEHLKNMKEEIFKEWDKIRKCKN